MNELLKFLHKKFDGFFHHQQRNNFFVKYFINLPDFDTRVYSKVGGPQIT